MQETKLFSGVMHDNFSGSGKILALVQQEVLSVPARQKVDVPLFLQQLDRLENHFPQFALLFHFLKHLRQFFYQHETVTGKRLKGFVQQYCKQWENAQERASENLLRHVSLSGKNLLFHSNSSAIHNLFQLLASKKIPVRVWQTVSSPANEGLKQAAKIQQMGFPVSVFHEDAVGRFVEQLDGLILGVDLLWEEAFLNKTGSMPLALVFKQFDKPVYVLAEKRKIVSRKTTEEERFRRFLQEKPHPPEEIFPGADKKTAVFNYYFEPVPLHLVSRIFTEDEP